MRRNKKAYSVLMLSLIALAAFGQTSSYSQWEIQNSGIRATLRDIDFVDSLYGWAVGDSATIIATTNGGQTWIRQIGPVDTVEFLRVKFIDRDTGFVGGNRITRLATRESRQAILLWTKDGGMRWEERSLNFGSEFRLGDMDFRNAERGWVGINNLGASSWDDRKGILLTTEDGGQAWTVVMEKEALLIGAVVFWNDSLGYSFWSLFRDNYDNTEVYDTQNAGLEWRRIGTIREDLVQRAKCLSSRTVWAIGLKASRSSDGGQTWNSWNWFSPVPSGQKRFAPGDIDAIGREDIWLVGTAFSNSTDGEGLLMRTRNSGESWEKELQLPGRFFQCLDLVSSSAAWIAGGGGLVIRMKDIVTSVHEDNGSYAEPSKVEQNYPNPLSLRSSGSLTTIRFSVRTPQHISIAVYDVLGRVIKVLLSEFREPGTHVVAWDGTGRDGARASAGVYFYAVRSETFAVRKKMIVIY